MEKIDRQIDNRNLFIDALRGISIFLVLWGHSIQYFSAGEINYFNNFVFRFIYSFHMPLFFLISGYVFYWSCRKNLSILIKKQIMGIGTPIIMWNFIQWLLMLVKAVLEENELSFYTCIKQLISGIYGLWFLWSVLIFSVTVGIIYKKAKNLKFMYVGFFLIWCMMIFLPGKIQPSKNFNVWLFPYFLMGFLFCKYGNRINGAFLKIRYLSLILFPFLLSFFTQRDYIYTSGINPFKSEYGIEVQIAIDIYRWVIGIVGSIFVITIIYFLYSIIQGRYWKLLGEIGRYTLQIYVIQRTLLETIMYFGYLKIVSILGKNYLIHNLFLYNFFWTPLISILVLVIIMLIAKKIGKKPKLSKVLFGR